MGGSITSAATTPSADDHCQTTGAAKAAESEAQRWPEQAIPVEARLKLDLSGDGACERNTTSERSHDSGLATCSEVPSGHFT
jgi:hypothetical protein